MNYYHMTSLNNLASISKKGLIPGSGANSKLIGDDKIKTFFSEGFEGVYLRFDGTNIKNERNFENGCADMTIPPEDLTVYVLQRKNDHSIVFSRFEIIKYMMATVQPEQIQYYGTKYDGSPDFEKATCRIQEKFRMYYENHQTEIMGYDTEAYQFDYAI